MGPWAFLPGMAFASWFIDTEHLIVFMDLSGRQHAKTLASSYLWDVRGWIHLVSSDMHLSVAASGCQYSKLLGQGLGVLTRADQTDQACGVPLSHLQMLYLARDTSKCFLRVGVPVCLQVQVAVVLWEQIQSVFSLYHLATMAVPTLLLAAIFLVAYILYRYQATSRRYRIPSGLKPLPGPKGMALTPVGSTLSAQYRALARNLECDRI
jgi:hypothetical protein